MSYVQEKNCFEDETMTLVSSKIWEKIIRTIYFLNAKSCFVNFNNNFCPHQNVIKSSDRFLEKKNSFRFGALKILHLWIPNEPQAFWGIATEGMKNLVTFQRTG